MNFPKVFVIILNYNGKETLNDCLKSVFQSDYPSLEVVLVDNNSRDGSFEAAKNIFSRAHFIRSESNIGFAAGNNLGIRFALEKMADYVFLLNNDATIEKETLSRLIEAVESDNEIGLLSPVIYKGRGEKIWFSGGKINWLKMRTVHLTVKAQPSDNLRLNLGWSSDYITGCAMLVKKEVFKKIGLLDENFFLYYEDADFSLRARKDGFKLKIVSEATVHHLEKSEENKPAKIYWLVLSGILFFKKNTPWYGRPYINVYLWLRKLKNRMDVKKGKNKIALEIKRAYEDSKKISI